MCRGLNCSRSIVTSDADLVAGSTLVFATSTALFACSSSVIVSLIFCEHLVCSVHSSLCSYLSWQRSVESGLSQFAPPGTGCQSASSCLVLLLVLPSADSGSLLSLVAVHPFPTPHRTPPPSRIYSAMSSGLVQVSCVLAIGISTPRSWVLIVRDIPIRCNSACFEADGETGNTIRKKPERGRPIMNQPKQSLVVGMGRGRWILAGGGHLSCPLT